MQNINRLTMQVEKIFRDNELHPGIKKIVVKVKSMSSKQEGVDLYLVAQALKSNAEALVNLFDKKFTKKRILNLLDDSKKYEAFLNSNYISTCIKVYKNQILDNKYLKLINKNYKSQLNTQALQRPRCKIGGVAVPCWLLIIVVIIIIIIILL